MISFVFLFLIYVYDGDGGGTYFTITSYGSGIPIQSLIVWNLPCIFMQDIICARYFCVLHFFWGNSIWVLPLPAF